MSPKNVKKLTEKKYREESGLFIVEGDKNIRELLTSDFVISDLFGTKDFLAVVSNQIAQYETTMGQTIVCTETKEEDLVRMGTFMTNSAGIAVAYQKDKTQLESIGEIATTNTVLVLDDIKDPGNLGTIIRIADWYGISHIIASLSTTDFYNPKTITASMGSFTRIHVSYYNLEEVLPRIAQQNLPIITADMHGENIHTTSLPSNGFLVMGSESHGIGALTKQYATNTVTIPRFGKAESLNVSVATGILLDAIKRN